MKIFVPSQSSKNSYTFKLMCEGGVVGDRVFSQIINPVVIMKDASAPRSYKDVCKVTISVTKCSSYVTAIF